MELDWEDILEKFNNNDFDVDKYFNDYQTFFKILEKRGLMSEVDPKNAVGSENWQNEYLIWLYQNDKKIFNKWVSEILDDVEYDESGNAFLVLNDRGKLSELFCSGHRQEISQDTIETILSDEGDVFDYSWDTTDDVYRDVIGELDEKNIGILKEIMISMLSGEKLSPESSLTEDIAMEQGHEDYWEIDGNNVERIINDEESMNELLNNQLSDVKSNLYSIHSNAYSSAYESDIWDEIWEELSKYFEGSGEWVHRPHSYKKNTQVQLFKIPINDLDGILLDYLSDNARYGQSGTLEYQGSLINVLREDERNCLSIRVPDYPSYGKINKNINEFFADYI